MNCNKAVVVWLIESVLDSPPVDGKGPEGEEGCKFRSQSRAALCSLISVQVNVELDAQGISDLPL